MAKAAKENDAPDDKAADAAPSPAAAGRRLGVAALALVAAAAAFVGYQFLKRPAERPMAVTEQAPAIGGPFSLVDHEGRAATDGNFRERFMLVYFGYTFCPDVCPTALTEMTNAVDILGDAGDKVIPVFVTIDPERDRPEHLKEYLGFFHPRMVGLTGTPEQVQAAAQAYRVYFKKQPPAGGDPNDYLVDHTSIVYLMGPGGKFLAHFSHGTSADAMAAKIRTYL